MAVLHFRGIAIKLKSETLPAGKHQCAQLAVHGGRPPRVGGCNTALSSVVATRTRCACAVLLEAVGGAHMAKPLLSPACSSHVPRVTLVRSFGFAVSNVRSLALPPVQHRHHE